MIARGVAKKMRMTGSTERKTRCHLTKAAYPRMLARDAHFTVAHQCKPLPFPTRTHCAQLPAVPSRLRGGKLCLCNSSIRTPNAPAAPRTRDSTSSTPKLRTLKGKKGEGASESMKKVRMLRVMTECGARIETRSLTLGEWKSGWIFCPVIYADRRGIPVPHGSEIIVDIKKFWMTVP